MSYNLACEWAKDDIRVNVISPWYIETPLAQQVLKNLTYLEEVLSHTPARRIGQPHEGNTKLTLTLTLTLSLTITLTLTLTLTSLVKCCLSANGLCFLYYRPMYCCGWRIFKKWFLVNIL